MDTAVEDASSLEELEDDASFDELSAKLSTAWDKIIGGDFKRRVQIKEIELSNQGRYLNGRQCTWMVYQHFKLSENDTNLLDWDAILSVKPHGENLQMFLSDWETMLLRISPDTIPGEDMLESLFRKQLDTCETLKPAMQLSW